MAEANIDKDLATVRSWLWDAYSHDTPHAALDRVEAELARLREERDEALGKWSDSLAGEHNATKWMRDAKARAEAAEAEVRQLRKERNALEAELILGRDWLGKDLARAETAEARVRDLEELEEGYLDDIAAVNQRVRRLTEGVAYVEGVLMRDPFDEVQRQHAAQVLREALAGQDTPADSPEPREGIVMVYDWQHRYLGCMGVERWRQVLAGDTKEARDAWPSCWPTGREAGAAVSRNVRVAGPVVQLPDAQALRGAVGAGSGGQPATNDRDGGHCLGRDWSWGRVVTPRPDLFDKIRNRQAPKKHLYVERPAYIITEKELAFLEAIANGTNFHIATSKKRPPSSPVKRKT